MKKETKNNIWHAIFIVAGFAVVGCTLFIAYANATGLPKDSRQEECKPCPSYSTPEDMKRCIDLEDFQRCLDLAEDWKDWARDLTRDWAERYRQCQDRCKK